MKLSDRLKKIEAKTPEDKKIMVVKFGSEIAELSCGGEKFYRLEDESESDFVSRIKEIIKSKPHRPDVTILTSGF